MRKFIVFLLTAISVSYSSENLIAQVKISTELRPLFEYRNGYREMRDSLTKPAFVTSQRSRINLDFQKDNIQAFLSVQDIRIWGDEVNKTDASTINANQAWAEVKFSEKYTIKLGRQQIRYDDERLLSANNWNTVSSSHDLALIKYKNSNFQTHLGLAYNNDRNKYFESNYPLNYYKTLSYLWVAKQINNNLLVSAINISDGNQKKNSDGVIYLRSTTGANINYKNDSAGLVVNASTYYQQGKDVDGIKINAYFFAVNAGYDITKKATINVGIDYFSGNDESNTNNTDNNAFSNLYGTGHRYLGAMDYFTVVNKHTLGGGLSDIFGKIGYNLNNKLSTQLAYHYFQLTGTLMRPNNNNVLEAVNKSLGSELDLSFTYKYNSALNIQFGYSSFFAKESMAVLKAGNYKKYADWGWIMLTFKL